MRAAAGDRARRCSARWELYARGGAVDDFILPAPTEIAQALVDDRALLWDNFAASPRRRSRSGSSSRSSLGVALAIAIHFSPRAAARASTRCWSARRRSRSSIIAPLLVVWFGFGIVPKLAIIALVCFFPVVVTTLDALAAVDPEQRKLMRTLDALALAGVPPRRGAGGAARRR